MTLGSLFSLPEFPDPSTSRKYHQPPFATVIEVVYKTANIVPGICYLLSKYDFPNLLCNPTQPSILSDNMCETSKSSNFFKVIIITTFF